MYGKVIYCNIKVHCFLYYIGLVLAVCNTLCMLVLLPLRQPTVCGACVDSGMPNRIKNVYELEGLICDLYGHISKVDSQSMSKAQATDLISSTVFDYEPGAR